MNLIAYLHERGVTWFDNWCHGTGGGDLKMPPYSKDCFWSHQLLDQYRDYRDSH